MGYYTRYDLEADKPSVELSQAIDTKEFSSGYNLFPRGCDNDRDNDEWDTGGDTCKWYEHEDDIRALSLRFPAVLFTLHGTGEEQGDEWYKYFKGGKMQECRAVVTFEPYDESKLK